MIKYLILGVGVWYFYLQGQKKEPEKQSGGKPNNILSTSPRMNASVQPWYVQKAQDAVNMEITKFRQNPTAELQNFGSVIHNISDIWGQASAAFEKGMSSGSGTSTAGSPDMPPQANNDALPGGNYDQSNVIGDLLNNPPPQVADNFSTSNDNSSAGMIDAAGSDNYMQTA